MADAAKLEKIVKEINSNADKAVAKIKKETTAYLRSEQKKAEQQAKKEIAGADLTANYKLTEQMNADLSAAEKAEVLTLLRKRSEIAEEVFAEAKARIAAFTKSEGYPDLLQRSAKQIAERLGSACVLFLRPEDEAFFPALRPLCAGIETDRSILLGGIRAEAKDRGLIADDTLDARLAQQREAFYESSGLSVTL